MVDIFDDKGSWYRGVLHLHSQQSDGALTTEEVSSFYRTRGYDFIAITDHDVLAFSQAVDNFLSISGIEMVKETVSRKSVHLVALNVSSDFVAPENNGAQEAIDAVHEFGGEVIVAHPYWSDLTSGDLLAFSGYLGIEIYNTITHRGFGKGYSSVHWDEILNTGRQIYGFAVDDAHFRPQYFGGFEHDALGGYIMVKAANPNIDGIMEAIRRGYFYASCGPKFHDVKFSNGTIYIECSSVRSISFICSPGYLSRRIEKQEDLTQAEFKLSSNVKYVRVECQDRDGNKAWLNPYSPTKWLIN